MRNGILPLCFHPITQLLHTLQSTPIHGLVVAWTGSKEFPRNSIPCSVFPEAQR